MTARYGGYRNSFFEVPGNIPGRTRHLTNFICRFREMHFLNYKNRYVFKNIFLAISVLQEWQILHKFATRTPSRYEIQLKHCCGNSQFGQNRAHCEDSNTKCSLISFNISQSLIFLILLVGLYHQISAILSLISSMCSNMIHHLTNVLQWETIKKNGPIFFY